MNNNISKMVGFTEVVKSKHNINSCHAFDEYGLVCTIQNFGYRLPNDKGKIDYWGLSDIRPQLFRE